MLREFEVHALASVDMPGEIVYSLYQPCNRTGYPKDRSD